MRIAFGPIPPSQGFQDGRESWTPLRELESKWFVGVALLLAIPFVAVAIVLVRNVSGYLKAEPVALWSLVTFFVAMVPLHEFVHALTFPSGLTSPRLVFGVWPARGLCYVLHDGPVSRRRIAVMLVAPFVLFTSGLGVLALLTTGNVRLVVLIALIVHTGVCTGDFMTVTRVWTQVPAGALVQNDGWITYWKLADESTDHQPVSAGSPCTLPKDGRSLRT